MATSWPGGIRHIFMTRIKTNLRFGTLWNCEGCPLKQEASICHSGLGDNGAKWLFVQTGEFCHFSTWSFREPSFKNTVAQDWTTEQRCTAYTSISNGSPWGLLGYEKLMSSPEILSCKLCWGCKTISINTAANISLLSRMNTSCQGTEQYPEGILLPPKFHTTQNNVMESIRRCEKNLWETHSGKVMAWPYLLSIESDNAAGIYQRRCCLLSTWNEAGGLFQRPSMVFHGNCPYGCFQT